MMKKLARILSIIMICCISILCVGCMGTSPDDYDGNSGEGNFSEGLAFDMYGTKVLYRPDSYDYNVGSGAEEGQTNDYYGKYAYLILDDLFDVYGIINKSKINNSDNPRLTINDDKIPYIYDSIRYKVDTLGTVTHRKTADSQTATELEENEQYVLVGADLNSSWNWSFDYDLSRLNSDYNALLVTNDDLDVLQSNHIYSSFKDTTFSQEIDSKYGDPDLINLYTTTFLGTDKETDSANYSDYVKALEYVVYSYALDLEPKTITVTINDNVTSANGPFYTVNVQSYDSVDEALADIKELFTKIGSYVGLIDRQINKISAWIKKNVIGEDVIANDSFTTYQNITEVVAQDGSISYTFDNSNASTTKFRNYSTAVDNIVRSVCENVTIGKETDGSGVTIDNRFLASEVKEYAGNSFFITGDENFPAPGSSNASSAIQPLEYQSVQFMLKESVNLSDVWVALKYDADLDGTVQGQYDLTKYLDIIVELNYYNHTQNKLFTVGCQQTRIYDGPYKGLLEENTYGLPDDDHGTLFFSDFATNCSDETINNVAVDEVIPVGAYNTEIGNGILKTDVGESGYTGTPLVSENPLILVGTKDVRKYYSIIEPTDSELGDNQTYVTGRANEKMYAGSDGCDYIEITFKVLKKKGDKDTNYKFYAGVAAMFDDYVA